MNTTFENLKEEKKNKIINAAIEEFYKWGYKQATTDNIVKKAEISKGSLFQYFGNKEKLYIYVCEYTIQFLTEEFYNKMDMNIPDIFERVKYSIEVKLSWLSRYPNILGFLQNIYYGEEETPYKLPKELRDESTVNAIKDFFINFDKTKFKDDIDIDKAVEVIIWTCKGIEDKYTGQVHIELEMIFNELNKYIDFLRSIFYKEEYRND